MNGLAENKKFITTAELKDMGYSYDKIGKLEKAGLLRRVNPSTYENLSCKRDENDFFGAEAFVPNDVICLVSAARYYELTSFLPDSVDVAIERKKKGATLPYVFKHPFIYILSHRIIVSFPQGVILYLGIFVCRDQDT